MLTVLKIIGLIFFFLLVLIVLVLAFLGVQYIAYEICRKEYGDDYDEI